MALLLMAFWLVLNGRVAWDTLITGAAVTALLLVFGYFFGAWTPAREARVYRLLPGFTAYIFALIKEIFIANITVIKLIFTGKISPCVRSFVTPLNTRLARTVLANSITLTPGTATVQLVDNVLTVHCITRELADTLDGSALEKRLLKLEEKANGRSV